MNRYKNIIYFFHSLLQNTIYDHNHLQKGRRKRICMRPNINASWAWWGFGFLIHHVWYICNAYFLINLWYEKTNTLSTIMCLLQVTSSIRLNAFLTFNDFAKKHCFLKKQTQYNNISRNIWFFLRCLQCTSKWYIVIVYKYLIN